jgi:cytochrome oxidase Cu insertion factor (SCO1/SenC/PrrC family)
VRSGLATLGIMIVLVGAWLFARPGAPTGRSAMVAAGSLADLLMDVQIIPLDGQAPKPFALPSLDGRRVALSDLAGRPALLYFWATW